MIEDALRKAVHVGEAVGGGEIAKTRIGWGTHARGMGSDSERANDKRRGETIAKAAQSYEYNIENGLAIVGSPQTVIKKLQAGQQKIGYDIFCTNHEIGRMPAEIVRRLRDFFRAGTTRLAPLPAHQKRIGLGERAPVHGATSTAKLSGVSPRSARSCIAV